MKVECPLQNVWMMKIIIVDGKIEMGYSIGQLIDYYKVWFEAVEDLIFIIDSTIFKAIIICNL